MGRPRQYDVKDRKICQSCKYYYASTEACGYLLMTGHSRTIGSNGRRRIAKGKCDRFDSGDGKQLRRVTNNAVF